MKIEKIKNHLVAALGLIFGIYHILVLNFIPRPAMAFRSFHLLLVLLLTFLLYPTFKEKDGKKVVPDFISPILIVATIVSIGYAYFQIENILYRGGIFTTQ